MAQKKVSTRKKKETPDDNSLGNREDSGKYYSLSDLEQKIQNAQKLTSNIQTRISDLEMQSIFYQNQESTLEKKKDELLQEIAEINTQITSYKEKAHTIRKEIIDLQIKMQTAIKAIEVLQQRILSEKEKEQRLITSVFTTNLEVKTTKSLDEAKHIREPKNVPENDIFSEISAEIEDFAQKRKTVEKVISSFDQPIPIVEKTTSSTFVVEKLSFQMDSDLESERKTLSDKEQSASQSSAEMESETINKVIEESKISNQLEIEEEPPELPITASLPESFTEEKSVDVLHDVQENQEIDETRIEEEPSQIQFKEIQDKEILDQQQMCIICHLNINYSSQMLEDPTSKNLVSCPHHHLAHRDCLKQWILYSSHCPLCQEEYSSVILDSFQDYINTIKKERSDQAGLEKKIQEDQKRLAQQMSPDKPEYLELFSSAEQALKSKQYEQAIEHYWQVLDQEFYPPKDPRTLQTMLHLSIAYLKLKKYPQAIRQLMNLVKIDYYYPMVFYFLGKAYNGIGLTEQTTWAYVQALENVKILVKSNQKYAKYIPEIEDKLK